MKRLIALFVGCALLAGCTSSKPDVTDTTVVRTTTLTRTLPKPTTPAPFVPRAATTVTPLPPGARPAAGEVEADCPYIARTDAAELEGNRIYRTTVTTAKPVTCRFFFWCCDYHATLEIAPTQFATATAAYNAMVRTSETGTNPESIKGLAPGVDAVLYQTKFYGEDGAADWACTFAKGRMLVTVRTNQTNVSFNARHVAEAIVARF